MLVDADAYFRAARDAMRVARRSIFILSWDIDSRVRLVPSGANDGYPEPLADFLQALLAERRDLEVWLLNWDFVLLYAMEREWLPTMRLGWPAHTRLHLCMDARHPIGASHHQKILVVDDAIAFVGGLDLTGARWDDSEHRAMDPRRITRDGKPYGPFHDVQAAVDGDAAHALGELCRERWQRATGHMACSISEVSVRTVADRAAQATESRAIKNAALDLGQGGMSNLPASCRRSAALPSDAVPDADHWPDWLPVDVADVDVGISRTLPAYAGEAPVREVLQLHLDAIAAATDALLFENQYFTSGLLADALVARLSQAAAPEVLVITSERHSGWLEEATMGVRRARLQARLRKADGRRRYRLLCPVLPDSSDCLNLHSKVFFMDNQLCSIGSANLSNRSMACDTECNLSIEAHGANAARVTAAIERLRARLLAEHLGTTPERMVQTLHGGGSLSAAIDAFASSPRHLRDFDPVLAPELDALIPEHALFDPESPIDPRHLFASTVPSEARTALPWRVGGLVLLALALIALALAWRYTPLREWLNPEALVATAQVLESLPFTPLLVIGAYVVGGLLMVPVMLLIAVTGIVFGWWPGAPYALAGTLCAAAAGYGVGAALGRDIVRRLLGARLNRLSRRVARRGTLAMIVIRLLPLAPFGVINLACGASHIRLRDYLLGTLIGTTPGILLTTAFAHNLILAVRDPSQQTLGILLIVVLLLAGFAIALRRLLQRQQGSDQ